MIRGRMLLLKSKIKHSTINFNIDTFELKTTVKKCYFKNN